MCDEYVHEYNLSFCIQMKKLSQDQCSLCRRD